MKLNRENKRRLDAYESQLLSEQKLSMLYNKCVHNWDKKKDIETGEFGQDDVWCYYECNKCLKQTNRKYKTWELYPE